MFVVVVQSLSCLTPCDPINCSTPGFLVLHYLLECAQTHVHPVSDTIQPSHPLWPPSPLALNLSLYQGLFQSWPKDWSFGFSISASSEYSGLISFGIDRFDLLAVQGILKSLLTNYFLSDPSGPTRTKLNHLNSTQ